MERKLTIVTAHGRKGIWESFHCVELPFGTDEGTGSTVAFSLMKKDALECQPGVQILIMPENSCGTFSKRGEPSWHQVFSLSDGDEMEVAGLIGELNEITSSQ